VPARKVTATVPAARPVKSAAATPYGLVWTPPPNWPTPPAGWTPPSGWTPDPAWPPAPDGWVFWQPHMQGQSYGSPQGRSV
jgi:collagen type III alpha